MQTATRGKDLQKRKVLSLTPVVVQWACLCRTVWRRCSAWMTRGTARRRQHAESASQCPRPRRLHGVGSQRRRCPRSPTSSWRLAAVWPATHVIRRTCRRASRPAAAVTSLPGTPSTPSPAKRCPTPCPSTGSRCETPGSTGRFRTRSRRRHHRPRSTETSRTLRSPSRAACAPVSVDISFVEILLRLLPVIILRCTPYRLVTAFHEVQFRVWINALNNQHK